MDTRSTILEAAVQIFSQHGFRGSTTRRIADAASVNEVTIFRYFGSKNALLQEALAGSDANEFVNPLPEDSVDPAEELTAWCNTVIDHLRARSPMIRKCMGELEERPELACHATVVPVRLTNELTSYFRRLSAKSPANEEFNANVAANMLLGSLFHDAIGRDMMPEIFTTPASESPGKYVRMILRAVPTSQPVATEPSSIDQQSDGIQTTTNS